MINQLIGKIKSELSNLEANEETEQINTHFTNTISHIKTKIDSPEADPNIIENFQAITL